MAVLDIHLTVDEDIERVQVAVDGQMVPLNSLKGRVDVDDLKEHRVAVHFVGKAGSSLRYQIKQAGSIVAEWRGEIVPETEPYGTVVQYFTLRN